MSFLSPLKRPLKKYKLWGFDIETEGKDNNFVMGSIVGDDDIDNVFWDADDMVSFIKRHARKTFSKGYITATNLGFDILALLEKNKLFEHINPVCRNSRMIYVKIPLCPTYSRKDSCGVRNIINSCGNLKFIDTFNYAPFSVEKWGKLLKMPKLQKPSFLGRMPKNSAERDILERYNKQDSLITYKAISFLQEGFNRLNAEMKITAASTSMNMFRRNFLKENYYHPKENLLSYIHDGYYGGRTEAIIRGCVKRLKYYDINSMYPFVMKRPYPHPNTYKYSNDTSISDIKNYDGMAKVRIIAPFMKIPYLPFRLKRDGNTKLVFPFGSFVGTYTFFELRKALEMGYIIEKIYNSIIYFKTFNPFSEFIDSLYDIRKKYIEEGLGFDIVPKLNMNSLYGKFGQKNDLKEKIVHGNNVTMKMIEEAHYFERVGNFFIFKNPARDIPSFANPIFSAYTTAYARDVLYDYIKRCKESFYYCDTDSFITEKDFDCSNNLGDIKKVMDIKKGIIVKPKMYYFDDIAKCKGIRLEGVDDFLKIISSKKGHIKKFVKFKEANRRGLKYNSIIDFDKIINLEDDKRFWKEKFSIDSMEESLPLEV